MLLLNYSNHLHFGNHMTDKLHNENNTLDSLGLSVQHGEVEVGHTYPLYGMITNILSMTPGNMRVLVNYNIELLLSVEDADKIELIKERCFDPGIFVTTIEEKGEKIKGTCTTVVFGKKTNQEIN